MEFFAVLLTKIEKELFVEIVAVLYLLFLLHFNIVSYRLGILSFTIQELAQIVKISFKVEYGVVAALNILLN